MKLPWVITWDCAFFGKFTSGVTVIELKSLGNRLAFQDQHVLIYESQLACQIVQVPSVTMCQNMERKHFDCILALDGIMVI